MIYGIKQILIYSIIDKIDRKKMDNFIKDFEALNINLYVFERRRHTKVEFFVDCNKYDEAVEFVKKQNL